MLVTDYVADVGLGDSEFVRQSLLRNVAHSVAAPDLQDLFVGEFRQDVLLAFAIRVATFLAAIGVVLSAGTYPQMLRIYARWNIAGMANTGAVVSFSGWDWTIGDSPTRAMGWK